MPLNAKVISDPQAQADIAMAAALTATRRLYFQGDAITRVDLLDGFKVAQEKGVDVRVVLTRLSPTSKQTQAYLQRYKIKTVVVLRTDRSPTQHSRIVSDDELLILPLPDLEGDLKVGSKAQADETAAQIENAFATKAD